MITRELDLEIEILEGLDGRRSKDRAAFKFRDRSYMAGSGGIGSGLGIRGRKG